MGKNSKRTWQPPQLTTKAKIGIALIVIVFGGAVATLIITSSIARQLGDSSGTQIQDYSKKDTESRQKDALTDAAEALEGGNDKKAGDIYKNALAAETNPTKKVELAINQSKVLLMSGKNDEAIRVAQEAESYSEDKYLISDWLGRVLASGKRYNEAATAYSRAGSLVASPTNKGGYTKDYYDDKVASMKAQAAK